MTTIARRRKTDMVSALRRALESPEVPPEARERIETFLRLHRSALPAFDEMRPDLFVHRLIERIGLRKQHLFSDRTESLERLVNIAKFADLAAAWVRREPGRTSRDFAEYVVAVAAAGLREEEAAVRGRPSAVQVMTMHGAKGLEFDCVYVLGVQQSRMPGRRRARRAGPRRAAEGGAAAEHDREAHIAEMRRLLYVAMTRARRRLVLAWPEVAGHRGPDRSRSRRSSTRRRGRRSVPTRRSAARSCSASTRTCSPPSACCATRCWAASPRSARGWARCASTRTSTRPARSRATWSC